MYAIMSGWWTVSTAAKSRSLNASSPFFMSASRCAVRLVSVVAGMTRFLSGVDSYFGVYSNNYGHELFPSAPSARATSARYGLAAAPIEVGEHGYACPEHGKQRTRNEQGKGVTDMDPRPNIVLVHGAWADGSCWSGVIEVLQAGGYHVT